MYFTFQALRRLFLHNEALCWGEAKVPHPHSLPPSRLSFRPFLKKSFRDDDIPYLLPIFGLCLFAVFMAITLWTLQKRELRQQEEVLYRDVVWSRQKIRLGLARSREHIDSLAQDILVEKQTPSFYLSKARDILSAHPEVVGIHWIAANEQAVWSVPMDLPSNLDISETDAVGSYIAPALKVARLALVTQQVLYSRPFKNNKQQYLIYYAVPLLRAGKAVGVIGAFYSVTDILLSLTPPELTDAYKFTLLSNDGQVLATSSQRLITEDGSRYTTVLNPPWQMLTLNMVAYPLVNNLASRVLIALVCGLCVFILWGVWRLWRQSKISQLTQKALLAETAFRRSMEDSMLLGMRALDMEGRIIYVNPAFCRMIGWTESELLGQSPPFSYWPRANLEQLNHYLTLTLQGAAPSAGFQGPIQRKDGSLFYAHLQVSPLIDGEGQQIGWMGAMADITESKRAREELATAYARFTTLLESLDAAVSVLSPNDSALLFANRYYRQVFGDQAQGHLELCKLDTTQVDEDLDDFSQENLDVVEEESVRAALAAREMYLRMQRTVAVREVYLPHLHKWFDVRHRYVRWVDGHLAHVVIATDISARKQAEETAHRHKEELQFASRLTTMGEMASLLAHELNQPLGAIANYCMGAIRRVREGSIQQEHLLQALEKISAQAMRTSTIVSRIRSFVKRSVPQQRLVSIYGIIAEAVGLAEIATARRNVRIVTDLAPQLPECWLDPLLIEQVLVNLLKNAAEAMSDNKSSKDKQPARNVVKLVARLADEPLPPGLLLSVVDQGTGIDEANRERLFEPFYSTKSDGMGMGLNICRSIIESHHGRLWVNNNANGQGCTFFVLLPLRDLKIANS